MLAIKLHAAGPTEDRRFAARAPLGKAGTLRVGTDEQALPVTVVDLTRDGCRLFTDAVLAPQMPVRIGLANVGITAGRLVWRCTGSYGCAFDEPLPAGAVTAAFRPTNIAAFPAASPPRAVKATPRQTVALVAAVAIVPWAAIAALVLAVLR